MEQNWKDLIFMVSKKQENILLLLLQPAQIKMLT